MSRKSKLTEDALFGNGESPPAQADTPDAAAGGDAREPDAVTEADTAFDPAALEGAQPGPAAHEPGPPPAPAGIDFSDLALADDYEAEFAADGDQTTVVPRKACGAGFFRAHPEKWRNIRVFEVKNGQDRGFYLVGGAALGLLRKAVETKAADVRLFPARLTLCYGRDLGPFLWPLKLPQPGKANQQDEWSATALRVCKLAETKWVQLFCPRGASCYHWSVAEGLNCAPPWPSLSLEELAGIAFEGKYLTDPDDPVIRRQLGKE